MMFVLSRFNSLANQFIAELRNVDIQNDSMRFRRNLERLGEILAYEISKALPYEEYEVQTPLGLKNINLLPEQPVLATILRAGLPFHQGLLNYFDRSESAFISAYRKRTKDGNFTIESDYISSPDLNGKILIVSDPMLATAKSMVQCCRELLANYEIKELHIATIIASQEGIDYVKSKLPKAKLWIGDIDEELTTKSYIVPGLGDAGDLAYGVKV